MLTGPSYADESLLLEGGFRYSKRAFFVLLACFIATLMEDEANRCYSQEIACCAVVIVCFHSLSKYNQSLCVCVHEFWILSDIEQLFEQESPGRISHVGSLFFSLDDLSFLSAS